MNESHVAYLNLGSNIQPETNLRKALQFLRESGEVQEISSVWESEAVGSPGPNFLNVCVKFSSSFSQTSLKERVIQDLERKLGRVRTADKFAPRTIDIDIVIFDNEFINQDSWKLGYVIVPLAEIYPDYRNPETGEIVGEIATGLRRGVWLKAHPGGLG